jgi:hypothetical protein
MTYGKDGVFDFQEGRGTMLIWILILIVVIGMLIAVGMILGAGSRAARRRGLDRSPPPANVKVVERPQ